MIPPYKNQSINFHGKSTSWFLYDIKICLIWVKNKEIIRFSNSFFKKDKLQTIANLGKVWVIFLIENYIIFPVIYGFKLRLQTCNFIKNWLKQGCFLVKFAKFLRILILQNICERLQLTLLNSEHQIIKPASKCIWQTIHKNARVYLKWK